jgi:predicted esterase
MGAVAAAVAAANAGAERLAVDYPAQLTPYDQSSSQKTAAVTALLTQLVSECPGSKIVLLGYSQGAHIMGDSLCGGGGAIGLGPRTEPISPEIGSHGG